MKNILRQLSAKSDKWNSASPPRKSKAQSLVEFAVTLPVLLLLFSGVVEFGFALNYYLSILDATREAARYYSDGDPFNEDGTDNMDFYSNTASMAVANLDPYVQNPAYQGRRIILDPAMDDVIITVYAFSSDGVVSYPVGGNYSLYNHYDSMFTPEEIQTRIAAGSPNAGILLVEVHYNYHQVLGLPWLTPFVPDPILLRAYTIMPLANAEPVETGP